jgi:hypothetical protein
MEHNKAFRLKKIKGKLHFFIVIDDSYPWITHIDIN